MHVLGDTPLITNQFKDIESSLEELNKKLTEVRFKLDNTLLDIEKALQEVREVFGGCTLLTFASSKKDTVALTNVCGGTVTPRNGLHHANHTRGKQNHERPKR